MRKRTGFKGRALILAVLVFTATAIIWTVQTYAPFGGEGRVISHTRPDGK